jgi:hypothetical protein
MDFRDHALPTPAGREAMVRAVVDGGMDCRVAPRSLSSGRALRTRWRRPGNDARVWNNHVLSNRDGVLTVILEALLQESCVWLPLAPPASAPLRRASQPARHSVSDGGHPLPRSASLRRERE